MVRICNCRRVTGQRHCVYCGRGTPGQNVNQPALLSPPKDGESRQQRRRESFVAHFEAVTGANLKPVYQFRHHTGWEGMLRRDRRKLARAYAAGELRR